jgi:uncharacterized membrane protein
MLSFTFRFHFRQEGLKAFMLNKLIVFVGSDTVRALLKRAMITEVFNFFHIILGHTETVDALGIWTVIAVALLDFLFR